MPPRTTSTSRSSGSPGSAKRDLRRYRLEQRALGRLDLRDWSGILLGGGPFNSSDPEASKSAVQRRVEADLRGLLDQVISEDFPFLGACYGIGALGSHQGAVVDRRYAEPVGPSRSRSPRRGSRTRCCAGCPPPSTRSPATRRRSAGSRGTPSCSPARRAARSRRSGSAPASTPPSSIPSWTRTACAPGSTSTSTPGTSRPSRRTNSRPWPTAATSSTRLTCCAGSPALRPQRCGRIVAPGPWPPR